MGGATTRIPMSHRVLSPSSDYTTGDNSGDHPFVQLSGSIFGFLEENAPVMVVSSPETDRYLEIEEEDDDQNEKTGRIEDKIKFWETQHQNLHATLFRTTSLESKLRITTKEVIAELEENDNVCSCSRRASGGCRSCRMTEICRRLQNSGYNSAICRSKWKSSSDIPSGEHTYIDVIDNNKKGEIRVIIDLEFRGQFEMKKGSEEYNGLVSNLPEVFVGKFERLQTVIKILSNAAKRCMKEKKMHLGPWRKQRYMEAKWLRVIERTTSMAMVIKPLTVDHDNDNDMTPTVRTRARARASMLTIDLLDNVPQMSNFMIPVVEVL